MKEHEKNYVVHDMELEARIHALKICKHYLIGNKFMLLTNNIGLKYLFDKKTLNAHQARWIAFLSEYDFEIKHTEVKENIIEDVLNRQQHKMHSIPINNYEFEFKTLLKEASINDEQYRNWVEKCN